jgi:hypothetical protein
VEIEDEMLEADWVEVQKHAEGWQWWRSLTRDHLHGLPTYTINESDLR